MKPDRSGAAGRFEPENPHNVRDLSAYATKMGRSLVRAGWVYTRPSCHLTCHLRSVQSTLSRHANCLVVPSRWRPLDGSIGCAGYALRAASPLYWIRAVGRSLRGAQRAYGRLVDCIDSIGNVICQNEARVQIDGLSRIQLRVLRQNGSRLSVIAGDNG